MSSPGFGVVRRRRSEVWERGESKGAHEIDLWGMCSAQALARIVRRALPGAVHGDGEVAAVGAALEAAGRVARPRSSSARLEGGGGGCPRRVGASARRINGRNGREGVGSGAVGGVGGEKQSRGVGDGDKGRFVITKNSRD